MIETANPLFVTFNALINFNETNKWINFDLSGTRPSLIGQRRFIDYPVKN